MASFRLEQLFKGHLTQSLTPSETAEFYALVNDANHAEQLQHLADQVELDSQELIDLNEGSSREILDAILSLQQQAPVRRLWWRYVAAACVIALMAVGTIWLIHSDQPTQHSLAQQTIIAPGSNKAILITGDGKEMVLDGKGNIQIGNATIQNGVATYQEANAVTYNTLKTPRGGQFQVILPDGTHVWINSASQLRYPTAFTGSSRTVELEGEAYFEVTKNTQQPFIVKTSTDQIEVLGTHFNINAYSDEGAVRTTLAEGKVKVGPLILRPGQQHQSGQLTDADLDEVLAWKNGRMVYHDVAIDGILRAISRWYDVEIEMKGNLGQQSFYFEVSRSATLNELVKVLELNGLNCSIDAAHQKLIVRPQ